jgi:hypothetical protein
LVLFEFLTVGETRSKQINGPHHYQGHASSTRKKISITFAIRLGANSGHQTLQNISPNPIAAAIKRMVRFL